MNNISYKCNIKPRKEHKCDWCNKLIKIGEMCDRDTIADNGKIYNWYSCHRCKEYVREALSEDAYGEMSQNEFMSYMWSEHYDIAEQWWK